MANYPSSTQLIGTYELPIADTVVDRAVSGKPRLRSYHTQDWSDFLVLHELDGTEKDAILSHYAAHKQTTFTFVFLADDSEHTVRYKQKPQVIPIPGVDRWQVRTDLVVV